MALDFDAVANSLRLPILTSIIKSFTDIIRNPNRAAIWDQIVTNLPHDAQLIIEERNIQSDSILIMRDSGNVWIIKECCPAFTGDFILHMQTKHGTGTNGTKAVINCLYHSVHISFEEFIQIMEKEIASISS